MLVVTNSNHFKLPKAIKKENKQAHQTIFFNFKKCRDDSLVEKLWGQG